MDELNFFVDEIILINALASLPNQSPLTKLIESMESVIDSSIAGLYCFSDFYSLEINATNVGQIIFESNIDGEVRDLINRLQIVVSRSLDCEHDSGIGFGNTAIQNFGYGGLITNISPTRNNWWVAEKMHPIYSPNDVVPALRTLFLAQKLSEDSLISYSTAMFGKLYFHVPLAKIKNLSIDFEIFRDKIVSHFSYLNDHAQDDFEKYKQNLEIIANAGARGVEISPESPKTHKDAAAMKEREIIVDGVTILCEWHTKLDKQIGRVHFFPRIHQDTRVKKVVEDRVIIGIITDHLKV